MRVSYDHWGREYWQEEIGAKPEGWLLNPHLVLGLPPKPTRPQIQRAYVLLLSSINSSEMPFEEKYRKVTILEAAKEIAIQEAECIETFVVPVSPAEKELCCALNEETLEVCTQKATHCGTTNENHPDDPTGWVWVCDNHERTYMKILWQKYDEFARQKALHAIKLFNR